MTNARPSANPFAAGERQAHFIRSEHELEVALEQGLPVAAACGRRWVPSRDPNKFPVCPRCLDAALHEIFDDRRWGA